MTIETKTDKELIDLWERLTAQINTGQTAAGTSSIVVLSQIHAVLAKRGYRPQDGVWVKDEEEAVDEEQTAEAIDEVDTEPVDEAPAKIDINKQ